MNLGGSVLGHGVIIYVYDRILLYVCMKFLRTKEIWTKESKIKTNFLATKFDQCRELKNIKIAYNFT